jgi:hypothetical protein
VRGEGCECGVGKKKIQLAKLHGEFATKGEKPMKKGEK